MYINKFFTTVGLVEELVCTEWMSEASSVSVCVHARCDNELDSDFWVQSDQGHNLFPITYFFLVFVRGYIFVRLLSFSSWLTFHTISTLQLLPCTIWKETCGRSHSNCNVVGNHTVLIYFFNIDWKRGHRTIE